MSKYFDKMVHMNESLDRELRHKGLVKENVDPNSELVKKIKEAGLSVGFNSNGIEVSFADEDEATSKSVFQQVCDQLKITKLLQNVNTEQMLGGEFVTYGNIAEQSIVKEDGDGDEEMVPVSADSLTDKQKEDAIEKAATDAGLENVDQETIKSIAKDEKKTAGVQELLASQKNESLNTDTSLMDWDGPAIIKQQGEDGDSFYIKDDVWSSDIQEAYEFPSKEDAADKIKQLGGDDDMFVWPAHMKKDGVDESINESDGEVYLRMDDDDLDIHGYVQWDEENVAFVDDEEEAHIFDSKADAEAAILDICDKFNYDPETFTTQEVDPQVADDGENWVSLDPTDATATTLG